MTENESDYADAPDGKFNQLKYSVTNLWDEFGNTDSLGFAFVVNTAMILLGVVVFLTFDGLVSYAGAVWAIFNSYPIIQWVFGL
jgi:hypothetical protein